MKQRVLSLLLAVSVFAVGCGKQETAKEKRFQASFLTLFDTVTTIIGYAEDEDSFRRRIRMLRDELQEYHQLFDIYNEYEGINNLKTVNDQAGIAPVQVDERIIHLLLDCRALYESTEGRVNVAMGSVLQLWHEARNAGIEDPENAKIPDAIALRAAAEHIAFDTVVIDEKASTVYIADPEQRLDVGAIAKGWAVEQVCRKAPEGLLVSVGGNVRATGPRPTDGSAWVVGIQKPEGDADEYIHTLYVSGGSVVSSGDYQRYYTVDGRRYHHIIDPDTLYPADDWRSVTVLCPDSGLADALSTALFTLPLAEGEALAQTYGAEAMWLDAAGNAYYTAGFEEQIRT